MDSGAVCAKDNGAAQITAAPQVLDCVLHPGKGTWMQTWRTKFGGSFVPFPLSSTVACEHFKNSERHHPQLLLDCFAARWGHAGMGRFLGMRQQSLLPFATT